MSRLHSVLAFRVPEEIARPLVRHMIMVSLNVFVHLIGPPSTTGHLVPRSVIPTARDSTGDRVNCTGWFCNGCLALLVSSFYEISLSLTNCISMPSKQEPMVVEQPWAQDLPSVGLTD